jgi:transcriptional regulator GlxA family with amidase domain
LKVPDLTTTVLTLTLTGLSADSSAAGGSNPNWLRRVGAVAAIFAGAAAGAYLLLEIGLFAPLAAAGALVLFGTLACAMHPASARIVGP